MPAKEPTSQERETDRRFGIRLGEVAAEKGWTVERFAQKIERHPKHVRRMFRGQTAVTVGKATRYAKILKADLADLLDDRRAA